MRNCEWEHSAKVIPHKIRWSGKINQSSEFSCSSKTGQEKQLYARTVLSTCKEINTTISRLYFWTQLVVFSYYNQCGWRHFAILMTLACCTELVNPSHPLSLNFLDGLFSGSAIIAGDCGRATNNPQRGWHPSLPVPLWREECTRLTMACQRQSPCTRALKGDISRTWWHTQHRVQSAESCSGPHCKIWCRTKTLLFLRSDRSLETQGWQMHKGTDTNTLTHRHILYSGLTWCD